MTPILLRTFCLAAALGAAACTPLDTGEDEQRPDFNTMGLGDDDSRPAPGGGCVATERTDPTYKEVPRQVEVIPAEYGADGVLVNPPVYRNTSVRQIDQEGTVLRFPAPCPPVYTPEFIASVQRALAARGLYSGAITSQLDQGTRAAIRRYQSARGLDSDKLALETARDLGLVAVELEDADT